MKDYWLLAFILNFLLIFLAQRIPLLTRSGWIHAGILGTILWGCLGWRGWLFVVVYLLLGSIVTKIGFKEKQSKGIAEARGGRRGPENLWGSAATGTSLAILFSLLEGTSEKELLLIGFSASFAAKLADTFGSEIGKRWGRRTFLITSFRSVQPGTEGAISFEGTLATVLGSFLMCTAMISLSLVPRTMQAFLIVFVSGVIATFFESIVGAGIQYRYSWLTNELVNSLQTSFSALMAIYLAIVFL